MHRNRTAILLSVVALALTIVSVPPARAAVDLDLGVGVRVDDDTEVYVALAGRYFARDAGDVRRTERVLGHPDDAAVALFLAARSGRGIDEIVAARRRGETWWAIGVRLGVHADAWFVPVRRDPGPPYGKAYGHWKKQHKRKNRYARDAWTLDDDDARNLVAVRVLHEVYGVDVEVAMRWRSGGERVDVLLAREYRARRGHADRHDDDDRDHDEHRGKKSGKERGRHR